MWYVISFIIGSIISAAVAYYLGKKPIAEKQVIIEQLEKNLAKSIPKQELSQQISSNNAEIEQLKNSHQSEISALNN